MCIISIMRYIFVVSMYYEYFDYKCLFCENEIFYIYIDFYKLYIYVYI